MAQIGLLRLYKITKSLVDFIREDFESKTSLSGDLTHVVENGVDIKKKDSISISGTSGSLLISDTIGDRYLLEFNNSLSQSVLDFKNNFEGVWLSQGVVLTNDSNNLIFEASNVGVDFISPIVQDLREESFLYRCIDEDDVIEEISYRELAEEIFVRDEFNSRRINVELMFSHDKASLPQIAIREPAKSKGQTDGIGGFGEDIFENSDGSFNEERRKSYSSQFELLITSPNRHEVIIMEEVLLGLFTGAQDTLSSINPFYNFNFSSKELMLNHEVYAERLFVKSIGVNVSYDKSYPNLTNNLFLNKILFEHNLLNQ